jgi:ABC-type phosphate transport system ATPase subunit
MGDRKRCNSARSIHLVQPCVAIIENVACGPRLYGQRNRKVLNTIVEKQLRAVRPWDEVKDRLHAPASALSVGQQQRLCLARGLAAEPEVLLCDEATTEKQILVNCATEWYNRRRIWRGEVA